MPLPVPLQPVVSTPARSRSSRRPSVWGVSFLVSAVICAAGLGFLAGRSTAPPTTASAGLNGGNGRFSPGQGFPAALPGASAAPAGDGAAAASPAAGGGGSPVASPGAAPGNGRPAGGFAGRGGGQQGTVTTMDASGLTLKLASGDALQVTIGADTTYHRRVAGSPADVTVGAQVQIEAAGGFGPPGAFGGRGGSGAAASPPPGGSMAIAATGITVLEGAAAVTPAPAAGGQAGRGFGGQGGLQGTVTAIDAAGLTVQLALGPDLPVTTSSDTVYYRRLAGSASDVTVGSEVLVQVARTGFGPGGAAASPAPGSAPAAASDITVLEP